MYTEEERFAAYYRAMELLEQVRTALVVAYDGDHVAEEAAEKKVAATRDAIQFDLDTFSGVSD